MELTLAQGEMLPMWLAMCEDWRSGRIASMNFLSSYSNFSLQAYFPDDCQRKFPAIRDAVRALVVEEPPRKMTRSEEGKKDAFADDNQLLDESDWAVVREFGLDQKTVIELKRLAVVSRDAMKVVLGKLRDKSDVRKPSQFVTIAARKALGTGRSSTLSSQ